jgi:hypothetical protein
MRSGTECLHTPGCAQVAALIIRIPRCPSSYIYSLTSPLVLAVSSKGPIYIATSDGYLLGANDMTGAGGSVSYWSSPLSGISLDKAGTLYVSGSFSLGLAQVLDSTSISSVSSAFAAPDAFDSLLADLPAAPCLQAPDVLQVFVAIHNEPSSSFSAISYTRNHSE